MRKHTARRKYPVMNFQARNLRITMSIMAYFWEPKLRSGDFADVDANTLALILNVSHWMAKEYGYGNMRTLVDNAMQAWLSIRQRFERTRKWGASGAELQIIDESLPLIAEWTFGQPMHRYELAYNKVFDFNDRLRAGGLLYAEIGDNNQLVNEVKKDSPCPPIQSA